MRWWSECEEGGEKRVFVMNDRKNKKGGEGESVERRENSGEENTRKKGRLFDLAAHGKGGWGRRPSSPLILTYHPNRKSDKQKLKGGAT